MMDTPLRPNDPMRGLNNEGETPRQEATEPKDSKREENKEIRNFARTGKPQSMFDAKPGDKLPHESKFKK
jgi:hypothetical protein